MLLLKIFHIIVESAELLPKKIVVVYTICISKMSRHWIATLASPLLSFGGKIFVDHTISFYFST